MREKGGWPPLLIALLGFAIYANTLHAPFVFDDHDYILKNPLVTQPGLLLNSGRWEGLHLPPAVLEVGRSRIFALLTLRMNYALGGQDTVGYHAVNIAIHVLSALLVYALGSLALRTPRLAGAASRPGARYIPLFAALLFVSHPVQTQAVTYITQRFSSLAAYFISFRWPRMRHTV